MIIPWGKPRADDRFRPEADMAQLAFSAHIRGGLDAVTANTPLGLLSAGDCVGPTIRAACRDFDFGLSLGAA